MNRPRTDGPTPVWPDTYWLDGSKLRHFDGWRWRDVQTDTGPTVWEGHVWWGRGDQVFYAELQTPV